MDKRVAICKLSEVHKTKLFEEVSIWILFNIRYTWYWVIQYCINIVDNFTTLYHNSNSYQNWISQVCIDNKYLWCNSIRPLFTILNEKYNHFMILHYFLSFT